MIPFCLILEPVPLVARDLATTARENLGFEPLIAATEAEALRLLANMDASARLQLAFVNGTASNFASSALRPLLEMREANVVLLGTDAGEGGSGSAWPSLASPFSTQQVLSLVCSLERLARKPTAC